MLGGCCRWATWKLVPEVRSALHRNTSVNMCSLNKMKTTLKQKYQRRKDAISADKLFPIRVCFLEDINRHEYIHYNELKIIDKSDLSLWSVHETVSLSDILSCEGAHDSSKRTIFTLGASGIGKTTAVQSFTVDWMEGKGYQDVSLVFHLPFWELNLLHKKKLSWIKLIHRFYPELKGADISYLGGHNVWFVFDGLDECRFPLRFTEPPVRDVAELSTVDTLLTSLIRGDLLPNARVWITARPQALSLIPRCNVLRLTEIQGFSDEQKEQHFKAVFDNDDLAYRAICHVKISRSLDSFCEIPQICAIMAYVLKNHLDESERSFKIVPINLTEMYVKLVKTQAKENHNPLIDKLKHLALNRLGKANIIYEQDLRGVGIGVREASQFSMECPLLLKEERGLNNTAVYRFTQASVQEFFAASFTLDMTISNRNMCDQATLFNSCRALVDLALQTGCGKFYVFLRFIYGLLKHHGIMEPTNMLIDYTAVMIMDNILSDCAVLLLHCIREFESRALLREVNIFRQVNGLPIRRFSKMQWEFLSQRMGYFEGELEVSELNIPNRSDEGILRKLHVILKSRKAMLRFSNLTVKCCPALASVLSTMESYLQQLDLGFNSIGDDGVEKLVEGLTDKSCRLVGLRLQGCGLTSRCCAALASALTHCLQLRELDVSGNELGDDGLAKLSDGLRSPTCKLDVLRLSHCDIKEDGCLSLASALQHNDHQLNVLDLSINKVGDRAASKLFEKVEISKLIGLEMYCCNLTAACFERAKLALPSEASTMTELNLSCNPLRDKGVYFICENMLAFYRLEKLNLSRCGITAEGCHFLGEAMWMLMQLDNGIRVVHPAPWRVAELSLDLSFNCLTDMGIKGLRSRPESPYNILSCLNLSTCGLTGKCCADLAECLAEDGNSIIYMDLSCNKLGDRGLRRLCDGLRSKNCIVQMLSLRSCGISSKSVEFLIDALKSNPKHLEELHLAGNNLDDAAVKVLTELTSNRKYQLCTLDIAMA